MWGVPIGMAFVWSGKLKLRKFQIWLQFSDKIFFKENLN